MGVDTLCQTGLVSPSAPGSLSHPVPALTRILTRIEIRGNLMSGARDA